MRHVSLPQLQPNDEHNRQLAAQVHPSNWQNPRPDGRYNLVVIGAGTAGLVTAAGAAGLGAKVALIERDLMGGDCLNVGCVPSKAVISAARMASLLKRAPDYGITLQDAPEIDFAAVMQRMRRLRAQISPHDSAHRFQKLGIDVYLGEASFLDPSHVEVDGRKLAFRKAVIATGTRPVRPSIPGLDQIPYLTNESVFSLTQLPPRLGIIGAGPIGCELAQAFALLGANVSLIEASEGILPKDDRDAAALVERALVEGGVKLHCCGKTMRAKQTDQGVQLTVTSPEQQDEITVDQLLVAAGRRPKLDGLGLERAGVEYEQRGIRVNDRLRTTNRNIFAAGDVCSQYRFTHAADFMARIVIQNALFQGRKKLSSLVIPWCTYTLPEIAHVGINEREAAEKQLDIDTYTQHFEEVDRAILDGEEHGFVKVHTKRGSDTILGATIVSHHAGDLLSEIMLAMTHGIGLAKIANTIHPYPTQAEAIRRLGDQYNRTRLTPTVKTLFRQWLRWTR